MSAATNQITSLDNSRYEVIASELATKNTFRLDKYNGNVYVLVAAPDNKYRWEPMYKEVSHKVTEKDGCVNYQLFISGMTSKATYLINVHTGTTWVLSKDEKNGERFWGLLQDCL